VRDSIAGSGTVLQITHDRGLHALRRDIDPLAVFMAHAWDTQALYTCATQLIQEARVSHPWLDDDSETLFIDLSLRVS